MKNLPIERQICTLEQAETLSERLGDDAPGSLWSWKYDKFEETWELMPSDACVFPVKGEKIAAYTGDELGVLLPAHTEDGALIHAKSDPWKREPFYSGYQDCETYKMCVASSGKTEAQAKAALAIQGLRDGWLKKEDFKYGR